MRTAYRFAFVAVLLTHCGGNDAPPDGPGPTDASSNRTDGAVDAGSMDASAPDASAPDASARDAAALDAAASDAALDSGMVPTGCAPVSAGNPIVDGWYADPDMKVYGDTYWVYPTYSAVYEQQTFLDAFSSPDLVHWTKHSRVLDSVDISWATRAVWAPSPIERNGTYYLYFGANDIQSDAQLGGIGVATADDPAGPFTDAIGAPLIGAFQNGAQPIDQNVFIDDDGQAYMYYGGHGHCNVVKLNEDMTSLGTFDDGDTFKEVTPDGYVEGALMFKRSGTYYFMWSEGGWTGPDYRVAYAMADSPLGPFDTLGTVLAQDAAVARGSGHNTVVNVPGTDDWYIFYHRRPLGEIDGNHRVLSYDRLEFREDGTIKPVVMTTRDNFCDGNDLGFERVGGTWTVADGVYRATAASEAKSVLNTDYQFLDYDGEVAIGDTGHAGLLFRARNVTTPANGYEGYYVGIDATADRVFIGRADGATFTELANAARAVDPGTPYHLSVSAHGSTITVRFDHAEAPTLLIEDDTYLTGTTGVLAANGNAHFDDLEIVTPPLVIFYEDGGFGGRGVALEVGDYTGPQMNALGLPNDWVSSLRVPEGYVVEMFEHNDFEGTMWTFQANAPLVPDGSNDAMSSVRVRRVD